jgi:hypothetical protein
MSRAEPQGNVIPGRPAGPGPESMNAGLSLAFTGLCSWIPGSRLRRAPE